MATLDLNNQLVCQNPPSGRTSKFKFVPPEIPEKLANFTLVKSDHREYTAGQCEVQNGTLVNTRDYHVSEDGSLVHVGKLVFCLCQSGTSKNSFGFQAPIPRKIFVLALLKCHLMVRFGPRPQWNSV